MVFEPHDVGQNRLTVAFAHQPHRHAGDRFGRFDIGGAQCHVAAADRRHRRRTVGFENLTDQTDGLRRIFKHRFERPLGQVSVPQLAAPRRLHRGRFADAEARKIVMHHERLVLRPAVGELFVHLGVFAAAERECHQRLRLPPRKKARSVCRRQHVRRDGDRTHLIEPAPVGTDALGENLRAHRLAFDLFDRLFERMFVEFGLRVENFLAQIAKRRRTFGPRHVRNRFAHVVHMVLAHVGHQRLVRLARRTDELGRRFSKRLEGFGVGVVHAFEVRLRFGENTHECVFFKRVAAIAFDRFGIERGVDQRIDHHRIDEFHIDGTLHAHFDHQQIVARAGEIEIERALCKLGMRGVVDDFVVDFRHPQSADTGVDIDIRHVQRRRGRVEREHLQIGFVVDAEHHDRHLDRIGEAFGKQRAQRTVHDARRERFEIAGLALAFDETARNLARGVGLFDVLHRQRQKAFFDEFGLVDDDRGQNDRLARFEPRAAVGLPRDRFESVLFRSVFQCHQYVVIHSIP